MSDRRATEKAEELRSPPHNLEAEQALLGALLVNNDALHLVATFLEPDHFFLPVHGRIYAAVMHMVGRQETANPVTLKTYFADDEALKEAGGGQYLARLAGSAVTIINAGHYGRAVHDLYIRRQLIFYAEDVSDAAYDGPLDQPPREPVESAESKLHEIIESAQGSHSALEPIFDATSEATDQMERVYKADGKLLGVPLGIRTMEESVGGLQAPDYIEHSARRLKRRNRLDLLIVDHLQLMRSPRELRPQNRVQQISDFTSRIKALAKELKIPVLLLSQLNRAGERSDNKVSKLSDLRDSGSIKQDTDSILRLYREAHYLAKIEPDKDDGTEHEKWDVIMKTIRDKYAVCCGENRHGPTMNITCLWEAKTMSY